jgi:hypothetical protein
MYPPTQALMGELGVGIDQLAGNDEAVAAHALYALT